jgi:hypothetical protein
MDEIRVNERVHCPYHDDQDPSAYTVKSQSGDMGIYCSACKFTFWSNDARDDYDFGGFDRIFEAKQAGQQQEESEAVGLDRFFPPAPKFVRSRDRFLKPFGYEPGITMVKSAKGSGKTEALKALVAQVRRGEFRPDIARVDVPRSILLIGHRQSLIREAAAKLGIRCYLAPGVDPDPSMRTLAVCLDSLPKYNESSKPFDLVIIDESEQVLSHLLGATIEKGFGTERCFDALKHEVSNAKAVYVLDADLGLVTAHALQAMRPQDWRSRCRIIYNEPVIPEVRRTMRLHADKAFLERQMIEAIRRGERCFVVSNSKSFIKTAERMILNACGPDVVMRIVTSDNSRDASTIRFLDNIKTEILTIQVTLATPSIGTGIDITFPDGACHIDRVFGFFQPFVNTHTDIDQQLARVRNPGALDVWMNPATFKFTCNVDVIRDDLARAYTVKRAVRGRRPDGMVDYDRDDPLLMICAHVTALQRASKNRLVELFRQLREANGWSIEWVDAKASRKPYEEAQQMLAAERTEMLQNAEIVSDDDYVELDARVKAGAVLSKAERIVHEKNRFERTAGVPMDDAVLGMDSDGKLLGQIETLADIVAVWEKDNQFDDLVEALLEPTTLPEGRLQDMKPALLMAALLRAAELTEIDGFRAEFRTSPEVVISVDKLARFVAICAANRTVIEEILDRPLRGNFGVNPVRQLNELLERIGLGLDEVNVKKIARRKVRSYGFPAGRVETMLKLARSRLAVRKREEEAKQRARDAGVRKEPDQKDEPKPVIKPDLLSFAGD